MVRAVEQVEAERVEAERVEVEQAEPEPVEPAKADAEQAEEAGGEIDGPSAARGADGDDPVPSGALDPELMSALKLRKLTLAGFKSFADKTEFGFDQPITCVVGPNGCGKSNIVDAVKWVLGERSSKSLRGKEMLDVIFAGSAGRKPGGLASVGLTFENPIIDAGGSAAGRRPLPVDTEEVCVERQLYRDGTSRYVINGRRARLKDVRELFLDTGIGADAYSIIEQGKVDAMLLSSPQERRTIFEEAAGIAKYKARRVEAQRKLERTNLNLQRTRDQLESTERRLRLVRGQAAKARDYQRLEAESMALRTALAFDGYASIRGELDALRGELSNLGEARDEARAALARLEAERRDAEVALADANEAHRAIESRLRSAEHEAASAEQRRRMAERSIEEAAESLDAERGRVEAERHAIARAEASLEAQSATLGDLAERRDAADREVERLETERAGAMERVASSRQAASEAARRLGEMEREQASIDARIDSQSSALESLSSRAGALDAKASELAAHREERSGALDAARREAEVAARRCTEAERAIVALDERASALDADRSAEAGTLRALEDEAARVDSRRSTLEEMIQQRVGLGDGAQEALRRRDAGEGFASVLAPLAELIETDSAHAAAVEAALGGDLGALVIAHADELPDSEEIAGLPGRVRFTPIEAYATGNGEPEALGPLASMLAARVARVRDAVRPKAGLQTLDLGRVGSLLDRLLAGVLLVPTLESAALLASGPLRGLRVRYVTQDGSVLDERGGISAGPAGEASAGLLARAAELVELEARGSELAGRIEAGRAALRGLDDRSASIAAERARHAEALASARRAKDAAAATADRCTHEVDRADAELDSLRAEREEAGARHDSVERELDDLRARRERLDGLIGEQSAERDRLEQAVTRLEHAASACGDQLSAARAEAGRLSEQASSARRELHRLEAELDAARRRLEEQERSLAHSESRCAAHRQAAQEAGEARARASDEIEAARRELGEAEAVLERLRTEHAARDTAHREHAAAAREADEAWNAAERTRHGLEVTREHAEERAREELGLDLGAELEEYRALMSCVDVAPLDRDRAEAEVRELRAALKKLGNVNLDAIDEEATLSGKNERLAAEVADLDEASARLGELIDRLNTASRERFGEAFSAIREHFGGRDGMFRKLFGGGRAEIRLMPLVKEVEGEDGSLQKVQTDEVDLLDSGIEVIAKPPGKEPSSISQLSGGEKTLTAVALLMSIFRSKPSCFCVLDEVDAALDERNVGRFCSVVREFTDRSRFIVITHNKRTMQVADHLYGVTQQEKGVSKRVSVRFDQVGSDGSFTASGSRAPATEGEPRSGPGSARASGSGSGPSSGSPSGPSAEAEPANGHPRPSAALR